MVSLQLIVTNFVYLLLGVSPVAFTTFILPAAVENKHHDMIKLRRLHLRDVILLNIIVNLEKVIILYISLQGVITVCFNGSRAAQSYCDVEIDNPFVQVVGDVGGLHSHIGDINRSWEQKENSQSRQQQAKCH